MGVKGRLGRKNDGKHSSDVGTRKEAAVLKHEQRTRRRRVTWAKLEQCGDGTAGRGTREETADGTGAEGVGFGHGEKKSGFVVKGGNTEVPKEEGGRDDGSGGRCRELQRAEETTEGGRERGPKHPRVWQRITAEEVGTESV